MLATPPPVAATLETVPAEPPGAEESIDEPAASARIRWRLSALVCAAVAEAEAEAEGAVLTRRPSEFTSPPAPLARITPLPLKLPLDIPKPEPEPEPDAPGKMAVLGKLAVDASTVPALRLARTELKLDCMEAMRLDTGPAGGCVGLILASGGREGSSVIDFRRVLASRWMMDSTFSFDGEGGGRRRGLFGLAAVTAAVTVAARDRSCAERFEGPECKSAPALLLSTSIVSEADA